MIIFVIYGHFDTCLLKWHPKYASMEIPRKCLAMLGDNFEVMKIAVLGTPSLVNSSFACVALPDPLVVHSQEILSHLAQVILAQDGSRCHGSCSLACAMGPPPAYQRQLMAQSTL